MKKLFAMTVAVLLLFSVLLGIPAAYGQAPETGKTLDILFSHDTHSHLNTFTTVVEDEETDIGGFARANTLIKAQRAKDPDTLVIDGGDFSMGTLIQTVFETQAAELRMLGYMGYDVTTFGNHEFDYRSKGLANMLTSARTSGDAVPDIVVCNVDWDAMEAAGLTEGQQLLKDAFTAYGVQDYTVVQKGDVRIAVVGVFGKDALSCAPTCELKFKDPVQAVKATVAEIKANENVDMIVCVSHSGTWDDPKKSEDERFLASPHFALEQCKTAAGDMAEYAREALLLGMGLVTEFHPEQAKRVENLENLVDSYEDQLGTYLVKLSSRNLSTRDSHTLSTLLHCIGDFERICDHAINLVGYAQEMAEKDLHFSAKAEEELKVFTAAVQDIMNRAVTVFKNDDLKLAKSVEPLEEVIDGLNMEIKRRHIRRLRKGKCTIELGLTLSDITTCYERVADHCSNIAVCLLQVNEDGFDTHGYLEMVRDTDNPEFRAEVAEFEHKYELPRMKKDEIDSLPTIALEETDTASGEKSDFLSSRIQERKKKRKDGKKK